MLSNNSTFQNDKAILNLDDSDVGMSRHNLYTQVYFFLSFLLKNGNLLSSFERLLKTRRLQKEYCFESFFFVGVKAICHNAPCHQIHARITNSRTTINISFPLLKALKHKNKNVSERSYSSRRNKVSIIFHVDFLHPKSIIIYIHTLVCSSKYFGINLVNT